jgi:uncharacterized protein (DUF2252 family)
MLKLVARVFSNYRKTLPPERAALIDRYRGVDIARKVVGVGSVGTRCWIVVLQGRNADDHLVIQIKEAEKSVLEPYCGKSGFAQNGERVVRGQRAMQSSSDVFLGWMRAPGLDGKLHDYYVRQLWDGKGSFDLDKIGYKRLRSVANPCGATLAKAHARTGNRFVIAGYLGKGDSFDKAIARFARAYADQAEADYLRFKEALERGGGSLAAASGR